MEYIILELSLKLQIKCMPMSNTPRVYEKLYEAQADADSLHNAIVVPLTNTISMLNKTSHCLTAVQDACDISIKEKVELEKLNIQVKEIIQFL